MNSQQSQYKILVEALLPTELFQYFEITDVRLTEKEGSNPPCFGIDLKKWLLNRLPLCCIPVLVVKQLSFSANVLS
jgi:hypothetical protein